jgi:rhodanese-related sulfurtransferase
MNHDGTKSVTDGTQGRVGRGDAGKPTAGDLRGLEPLGALSLERLEELADLCFLESVPRGGDPLGSSAGLATYLVRGELALTLDDGSSTVLVGGTGGARARIGAGTGIVAARAVTNLELVRVDDDLLDLMITWDQVTAVDPAPGTDAAATSVNMANWSIMSGMFSVSNMKFGAFSRLPATQIEQLLARFQRIPARAGEVIVREGAEGDFYYVIESGRCRVDRQIGGVTMQLAELKSGDAFGEEALVSEARRNATVTMKSEGMLLKLGKADFIELLREPFLQRITMDEAKTRVQEGGQWMDVRYPSEYQYDHLPGAINVPLAEVRHAFGVLDRNRDYIVYCQSERRSSAAAFLLAQQGYRAWLLAGGQWGTAAR